MYLKTFRIQNFRRLKNVRVDLEQKETIFVGANNSGKTSATHAFRLFLDSGKSKFKVYDFSASCWKTLDLQADDGAPEAPVISLDLWFSVDDLNLHRVINILPSLNWKGKPVGIRLCYQPKDIAQLISNYRAAREQHSTGDEGQDALSVTDYLERTLTEEYEIAYYILDAEKFDPATNEETPGYAPHRIESTREGAKLINSLLRVDFLDAQRHLSDSGESDRHENLSKRLARYYAKNAEKPEVDPSAIDAIRTSEGKINEHLKNAFTPLLTGLHELGYPGVSNPDPVIKTVLNIEEILNSRTEVHYALPMSGDVADQTSRTLPDQYNGLGFKNLIFMVIELLDFHLQWVNTLDSRPPVHLIMIEEPEAHLHVQLQQVFIRKLFDLVGDAGEGFGSQFVITTHSPHILYESSFKPIRYFSRKTKDVSTLTTTVKDLSRFYGDEEKATREFLQKYLKLTHCDLFFSDGTVLIEGNVERLIIPLIIEKDVSKLRSRHLTLLEVGGAFAHKFEKLVEFLEIPTLIVTDLDSVAPGEPEEGGEDVGMEGQEDEVAYEPGNACPTSFNGALTSNETLKHWFSGSEAITSLLKLNDSSKVICKEGDTAGIICIAYQSVCMATWNGNTDSVVGRTLEEAFALENLAWTQNVLQQHLGLLIRGADQLSLSDLHTKIFKRVNNSSFDKTKFALGLIASDLGAWRSPAYIVKGLKWLEGQLEPAVLIPEVTHVTAEERA